MRILPFLALVAATSAAIAQGPPIEREQFTTLAPTLAPPPGPDVPPPPKNLLNLPPKHGKNVVPIGAPTRPQPATSEVAGVDEWMDDGSDYTVFRNPNLNLANAQTSRVAEPHAVMASASNGFFTHNWSAARTTDGGANWTRVNPFTRFPASFGGFCCDQVLATEPGGGAAIWLLQYIRNASGNVQRVAVADRSSEVGNDTWSRFYDFRASTFGYTATDWLDYPDCAATDDFFYFTSNVFSQAGGGSIGAVMWRVRISEMVSGGNIGISFINSPGNSRGVSFRLAHGARDDMFVASHRNTSTIRVIRWLNTGGFQTFERSIGQWTRSLQPAPGPDGLDWTQRADNRITAGFGSADEFGFAWHVGPRANRPNNYVRFVRFDASDATVKEERDVFSSSAAFMYPALAANHWGHVAMVCNVGGGTRFPSTCTFLYDELESFSTFRVFATGNSGPSVDDGWGDYLAVSGWPDEDQGGTFYGTGMRLSGGGANGNMRPEFIHFGREAFGPNQVALIVRSAPEGAIVTLTPDASGVGGGRTPLIRGYANGASYTATAPLRLTTDEVFDRWAIQLTPNGSANLQPVGQRTITVNTIGNVDDLIEARYVPARTLTVRSTNPSSGVRIQINQLDLNGFSSGQTPIDFEFKDGNNGSAIRATAPASAGCSPFLRWVVDGTPRSTGRRDVSVQMDRDVTIVAEYRQVVPGNVRTLGAGCPGSSGQVPRQVVTHGNGSCGPQQGTSTNYGLRNARPGALGVLELGQRTDFFGGFPLPLNLGVFGAPGCLLRHDIFVSPDFITDASGAADIPLSWPVDAATRGLEFYTTFALFDIGANPLNLALSNAEAVTQGGTL